MNVLESLWRRLLGLFGARHAPETTKSEGTLGSDADPSPAETPSSISEARRRYLARLSLALLGVGGVIAGIPLVGFLLTPNVQQTVQVWRTVGAVAAFRAGETVKVTYFDPSPLPWAGPVAQNAAWLRRLGNETFEAFSVYCSHTGCPIKWVPGAQLFLCPCHGGAFYRDGSVAAGPPSRPLARLPVRVRDGQVEILTTPVPVAG